MPVLIRRPEHRTRLEGTPMTSPYPLLFRPIYKDKVWGGRALERFGKTLPPAMNIGESWELADLDATSQAAAAAARHCRSSTTARWPETHFARHYAAGARP